MPRAKTTRTIAAFLLLGACALGARFRNEAEQAGLVGPVHTVFTQSFSYDEDQSVHPSTPNSLVTYSPEGFRTEEVEYDADGTVVDKTTLVRDGWSVLEEFRESSYPGSSHHTVWSYDACGRVAEMRHYDPSGSLRRKVVYDRSQPHLTEEVAYDGEGTPLEHGLTFVDRERRVRISRRYLPDGRLKSNWRGTWDQDERWIEDSVYYPKGALSPRAEEHRSSRNYTYRGDVIITEMTQERGGVRTKQWTKRSQKDGRILRDENIHESAGQYFKDVTQYDARQQPLEFASYDKRGLQHKTVSRYEYDPQGNWIKRTDSVWSREAPVWRVQAVTERRIAYY